MEVNAGTTRTSLLLILDIYSQGGQSHHLLLGVPQGLTSETRCGLHCNAFQIYKPIGGNKISAKGFPGMADT